MPLVIEYETVRLADVESAILVPEQAVSEPGYIRAVTIKEAAGAKHVYHAMAQMAYFQYQDDELEFVVIESPVLVHQDDNVERLDEGMLLYRNRQGQLRVLVHATQNRKKLLEAVYRYCTRWVRLDI